MRKRIILIVVIVLWGSVFYAAYRYLSTVNRQKAIDIDNERLYDFSINDYHIAKYYIDNQRLPQTLAEIEEAAKADPDSENIVPPALQDPETKQEYAYKPVSEDAYQICTTFATDTLTDRNLFDDYTAYITNELEQYAKSIYHKSGFDCMELSMAGNPEVARAKSQESSTSTTPPAAFTFLSPKNGDRVCLGSEYTLAWNGDTSTEEVGIYLVPPANLKQPQSWLQNAFSIPPGEITTDETYTHSLLAGSFDWRVGMLEPYEGKPAPEPVVPSKGYQLGVVTINGGDEHTYSSDSFEIADCNVASAVTTSPQ